jgi:hypothetical protein
VTSSLIDSSYHSIYAKAYDAAENEGLSPTITVIVYNGGGQQFYESDNFNSYPSSVWYDPTYVLLNGYGNWTSIEWNIMRGEASGMDSNYIQLRDYPPGSSNHATYHLDLTDPVASLTLGFTYCMQWNSDLYVLISPDNYSWTDVTSLFNLQHKQPAIATTADLSAYIASYGSDVYIRFSMDAYSGDYWMSMVDDFWVSGETQ